MKGDDTPHHTPITVTQLQGECIWLGIWTPKLGNFAFFKTNGAIWWLLSVKLLIKMNIPVITIEFCDRVVNCVKLVFIPYTVKTLGGGDNTMDYPLVKYWGAGIGLYNIPPSPRDLRLSYLWCLPEFRDQKTSKKKKKWNSDRAMPSV